MLRKSEILAAFRGEVYPDCPSESAERLFQEVARTVVQGLGLRNGEVVVELTAGQPEYGLDDGILVIHEVYFELTSNPTEWRALEPVTRDMLAKEEPGWRSRETTGGPSRYFLQPRAVGEALAPRLTLDPPPAAPSGTGYPRLRLYVTQWNPGPDEDTEFASLLSGESILFGMARAWAIRRDPERAAYWSELYDRAVASESRYQQERVGGAPPTRLRSPFAGRLTAQV